MALPKWGVVGTMDEPPELVVTYATYHLWAGASEVHIYLERDCPVTRTLLGGLASVHLTICDPAHWVELGQFRPAKREQRQTENANHAAARSVLDYLVHLDAGDFLHQVAPLEAELSTLREGCVLLIPSVERVDLHDSGRLELFSEIFRWPGQELAELGPDAQLTTFGLTGHAAGKAATPLGLGYRFGVHRPYLAETEPRKYPEFQQSRNVVILHFDGLTPLHWIYKRLRDVTEPGAEPAVHLVAQLGAFGDDPRAVHDRLMRLDAGTADGLSEAGLLKRVEFDPTRALRALLPLDTVDLSCERFDAWLKTEKAAFFDEYRFLLDFEV